MTEAYEGTWFEDIFFAFLSAYMIYDYIDYDKYNQFTSTIIVH